MSASRKKRLAAKERALTEKLRRVIVSGWYVPGTRLPVRRDLQRRFRVSSVTLQRAMATLMADGFIRADGRAGSFVSDRPPHLFRFGLAIPISAAFRFWAALKEQAELLALALGCEAVFYEDIAGRIDTPDYLRLAADVNANRLAGLLYAAPFQIVQHRQWFPQSTVPVVTIAGKAVGCDTTALCHDSAAWQSKALAYLKSRGRRRIAILTIPVSVPDLNNSRVPPMAAVQSHGMETRPAWYQATEAPYAEWASNAVQAMFQLPPAKRPDGLIITDDHLVEAGTRGVKAMGIKTPAELDIVAHCNYPALPKAEVPVCWLGFDARELMVEAIRMFRMIRAGQTPATATIPALFEEEWKAGAGCGERVLAADIRESVSQPKPSNGSGRDHRRASGSR